MKPSRSLRLLLLSTVAIAGCDARERANEADATTLDAGERSQGDAGLPGAGDVLPDAPAEALGPILAIGDSYFEWNRESGQSIPDVLEDELGVEVRNDAISGTQLSGGDNAIPAQYVPGDWAWLVMDGGGNDLNDQCGCGDCEAVLDGIVTADSTRGAVPTFLNPLLAAGQRVVFMAYPTLPDGAEGGFDRCDAALETLAVRMSTYAEAEPNVVFVDGRTVIPATDLGGFDDDRVHPSVSGSASLGRAIAGAILMHPTTAAP